VAHRLVDLLAVPPLVRRQGHDGVMDIGRDCQIAGFPVLGGPFPP
jgi:hypothetical protein